MTGSTWPRVRLAELGTWYGGGTPSKSRADFWSNGSVPWLSPKDMGSDTLQGTRDVITMAAVEGSAVRLVPAGSVAVVVRSGILERTLPISLVPFETTLNQDMKALVPAANVDARWVAWGLRSMEQRLLRECRKAGTTVASIETSRFMDETLPIPPLGEQRRLVDILEDHLSRLVEGAAALGQAEVRLRSLRELSLEEAFAHVAGEPTTLAQVARWGSGGTPRAGDSRYYDAGSIPWVVSGELRDGPLSQPERRITPAGLESCSAKWVPAGAVLVAMYGATIGRLAITEVPVTTNQAVAHAIPDASILSADYLFWFLRSQRRHLVAAGQGGAQPNISQSVLKEWPITVPDRGEQVRVVRHVKRLLDASGRLSSEIDTLRLMSENLRRSLLRAALTGRLSHASTPVELMGASGV